MRCGILKIVGGEGMKNNGRGEGLIYDNEPIFLLTLSSSLSPMSFLSVVCVVIDSSPLFDVVDIYGNAQEEEQLSS